MKSGMLRIDSYLPMRIRLCGWKHWEVSKYRDQSLIKLELVRWRVHELINSGKGICAYAKSANGVITNKTKKLKKKDKIVKKSVRFFYCFRSIIKITKGGISMCRNYEVKDITKTSRGISFLPKIKAEGAKTFEVVFSRLQAKKSLWIEIPVPMEMKNQVLDLFFVDIRGNLYQMETKKQSDCIGFYTNKVGFYILMARKQEKSTTLSKLRSSLYRV